MSKSIPSPDNNVPLPFHGEVNPAVNPNDARVQHIASFMVDKTEPEHTFSDQSVAPEQSVGIIVRGIKPIYDVVLDPDASEAAQNQGYGLMPKFRKHTSDSVTKREYKSSNRHIESRFSDIGKEPPHFDPSEIVPSITAKSDEIGPGHQEARDLADRIAVQNIMIVHGVNYDAARNIHAANVERRKNH